MSTTPDSALSPAGLEADVEGGETLTLARRAADLSKRASEQAGRLVDLARDNPRAAMAAGAAVAAGVAAAAAIPLVRARRKSANGSAAAKPEAAARPPARKRSASRKSPARSAKKD